MDMIASVIMLFYIIRYPKVKRKIRVIKKKLDQLGGFAHCNTYIDTETVNMLTGKLRTT